MRARVAAYSCCRSRRICTKCSCDVSHDVMIDDVISVSGHPDASLYREADGRDCTSGFSIIIISVSGMLCSSTHPSFTQHQIRHHKTVEIRARQRLPKC